MIIKDYINIAKGKIKNDPLKTFILAIYAGVFISLAGVLSTVASISITSYSLAKLLSAIVFPIGLIFVIIMKTELFTGNSLLVIPVLNKDITLKEMFKNWLIVYFGNLCGALIIAILIDNTPLKSVLMEKMIAICDAKVSLTILEALILGFLCNFLVCLAVYLASTTKNTIEKIILIFIPIFTFVALSFEHSIANMSYLSLGYLFGTNASILEILFNNLIPVTIGNVLGGSLLGVTIWYLRKE